MSLQAYGGDGAIQRIKRVAFDAKSTVMVRGSIGSNPPQPFRELGPFRAAPGSLFRKLCAKFFESREFEVETGSLPKLGFIRCASEVSGELLR